jgi:hypothetical protein
VDDYCKTYGHTWVMVGANALKCRRCYTECLDHDGPTGRVTQYMPRQGGKNEILKELALDKDRTWMEKHAPEILEEEERQELREALIRQQKNYDSSHEEGHDD